MPKSKHRKKQPLSKRRIELYAQTERNKAVRRQTYEKALPQYQQYPPMLLRDIKTRPQREFKNEGSHVEQLHTSADGRTFQTTDKREYEFQRDGSLRVINKPRSRVKRLRDERVPVEVKEQKLAA